MRKISILIVIFVVLMSASIAKGQVVNNADDFIYTKNYSFSVEQLKSITYGNKMFVAVGKKGAIKTSINGVEWVGIKPLSNNEPDLNKVVWNGKMFVAVGNNGRLITSKNGIDWTAANSGCETEENLSDIIWDGKQFVAVGEKISFDANTTLHYGIALKSSDGSTWSKETIKDIPLNIKFNKIIYTGREYLVSFYYSEDASNWIKKLKDEIIFNCSIKENFLLKIRYSQVSTSNDGEKWVIKGIASIPSDDYFKKVIWNGKIFVALDRSEWIQTSSDGLTWERNKRSIIIANDICWNGNFFVAIGKNEEVFKSTDGIKWTKHYSGMKGNLYDVVSNGKTFVAVGGLYEGHGITLNSSDGLKWTRNKTYIDTSLNSVIWDGKRFVASAGKSVFISTDGIEWIKVCTQKYSFNNIAFNGKVYVARVSDLVSNVGDIGNIAYSTNGKKWSLKKIGSTKYFSTINWNGRVFLLIDGNKAWVSSDGVNWKNKYTNLGKDVYMYSPYVAGTDFLINANNEVYKSKDGFNWTKYIPEGLGKYGYNTVIDTVDINFVRGHGSLGNKEYISPDGINWAVLDGEKSMSYDPYNTNINSITYDSKIKKYVIVGNNGTLITLEPKKEKIANSADDTNIIWNNYDNKKIDFNKAATKTELVSEDFDKEKDNLNSITYNGETYVAVGDNGVIRTSKNSVNWTKVSSNVNSKLNYVNWVEGRFIAIGDKGTILESIDGYTWNNYSLNNSANMKKVIWDGKRFIIFSDNGKVYINDITSSKGVLEKWKIKKIGNYGCFIDGDFNGKTYVISYGVSYESKVFLSNDFENWTQLDVIKEDDQYAYMYYNIMWDGEKFSATYTKYSCNDSYDRYDPLNTRILESSDGVHWEEKMKIGEIKDSYILNYNSIWDGYSSMQDDWEFECLLKNISSTERDGGKFKQVNKLTVWSGKEFVLCGKEGAIYTSKDGCDWVNRTTSKDRVVKNSKDDLSKIIWDGNKYIVWTPAGVFVSKNGVDWTANPLKEDEIEAVGTDGTVIYGKDKEWDKIDSKAADQYGDFYVYKSNNGYIAVGGGYKDHLGYNAKKRGIIFLSEDGEKWTSVDPNVEAFLRGVVYSNGKYVAVGENGTIITSNDGTTWEKQKSGVMNNLIDIASNGTKFVVAGDGGILLESQDGVNWIKTVESPDVAFYEIVWDGVSFKAAANYGQWPGSCVQTMFSSKDGIKWYESFVERSDSGNNIFACNGNTYVIFTGKKFNAFIVGKRY